MSSTGTARWNGGRFDTHTTLPARRRSAGQRVDPTRSATRSAIRSGNSPFSACEAAGRPQLHPRPRHQLRALHRPARLVRFAAITLATRLGRRLQAVPTTADPATTLVAVLTA